MTVRVDRLTIRDRAGGAIVRDVSFDVVPGRVTAIVGESGGGKSLIAQAIMGLLPQGLHAEGALRVSDERRGFNDPRGLAALWGRETLLLPQEPREALDPTLRVRGHLALTGGGTAVMERLAAVDLPAGVARHYPFMLSGGMAQRVLVATALDGAARLIVADEPTKGLDSDRVQQVADLLADLARSGRAILLISHDMALVRTLAERTWLLHDGHLAPIDPSGPIQSSDAAAYARRWLGADPLSWPDCETCATGGMVLAAHGLAARHGRAPPLFQDVHLHLAPGGVLGVAGPSGSGKSTLGDLLLGLKVPCAGSVAWGAVDPHRDPRGRSRLRRRYQKLHQDPASAFLPTRKIGRQLADIAEIHPPAADPRRIGEWLERMGLPDRLLDRYPAEVSGGEAQRLALMRLLLLDPAVIVADEPTSRLDPIAQKGVIDLLREIVERERLALVLIAHDHMVLTKAADSVLDLVA